MATVKVSLTVSVPSLAVTVTDQLPVAGAVPENVRVLVLKLIHAGMPAAL